MRPPNRTGNSSRRGAGRTAPRAFPGRVVGQDLTTFADQLETVVAEALEPDGRGFTHGISVVFPKQPADAFGIGVRHPVDGAFLFHDQRTVIRVRSARVRRGGDRHGQPGRFPVAGGVVDEIRAIVLGDLRSPEVGFGPLGTLGKNRPFQFPVDEVAGMQQRKIGRPFRRRRRRPIFLSHPDDGRVGKIARTHRVLIFGRRGAGGDGNESGDQARCFFHEGRKRTGVRTPARSVSWRRGRSARR